MAGFNMQDPRAPFQMLPPELLAQMAQGAFRPPQLPQAPPMPGGAQPEQAKFGMGEGMNVLSKALSLFPNRGEILNAQPAVTGPAMGAGASDWFDKMFMVGPGGTLVPR
jgi:hypothetical protein